MDNFKVSEKEYLTLKNAIGSYESTNTAEKAYSTSNLLLGGGLDGLGKVTSDIAQGEAIEEGTNVSLTSIISEITATGHKWLRVRLDGETVAETGKTYIDCNDVPNYTLAYTVNGTTLNTPATSGQYNILSCGYSENARFQLAILTDGSEMWIRNKRSGAWRNWRAVALMNADSKTSKLGEYKTGSAMIVNQITEEETHTALQSIGIQRGCWIIFGLINFSANANGYRSLSFSSTEPNLGIDGTKVRALSAGNVITTLSSSIFVNNTSYDKTTIFLNGAKATGAASTIMVSSKLEAVRIA